VASAADERAAAKRAQISAAARAVFLERGYAGASMDAVTAAAGVSKQTLYSYFPSKALLFRDFLDQELGQLRVDVGALPTITSRAQLRATLMALASALVSRFMREDTVNLLRVVLATPTGWMRPEAPCGTSSPDNSSRSWKGSSARQPLVGPSSHPNRASPRACSSARS
jgi:AcrR family transcriptional regulator